MLDTAGGCCGRRHRQFRTFVSRNNENLRVHRVGVGLDCVETGRPRPFGDKGTKEAVARFD